MYIKIPNYSTIINSVQQIFKLLLLLLFDQVSDFRHSGIVLTEVASLRRGGGGASEIKKIII